MSSYHALFKHELNESEDLDIVISDSKKIAEFLAYKKEDIARFSGNKSIDKEILIKDLMCSEMTYEYQKSKIFLCGADYRVDFYKDISCTHGVLVEVEGGGTINNNRIVLDWEKTQACRKASFLISVVPENTVSTILRRYSYKFESPEYYDRNVSGLIVIGY